MSTTKTRWVINKWFKVLEYGVESRYWLGIATDERIMVAVTSDGKMPDRPPDYWSAGMTPGACEHAERLMAGTSVIDVQVLRGLIYLGD